MNEALTTHPGFSVEQIAAVPDASSMVTAVVVKAEARSESFTLTEKGKWVHRFWDSIRDAAPGWVGRQVAWDVLFFLTIESRDDAERTVAPILQRASSVDVRSRAALRSVPPVHNRLQAIDDLLGIVAEERNFAGTDADDVVLLGDGARPAR